MSQFERGHHHIFRNFIGAAFHHQDRVTRTCNAQVQVRGVDFGEGLAELAEWVARQTAEDRVGQARAELEIRGLVA